MLWEHITADQQAAKIKQIWPSKIIGERHPIRSVIPSSARQFFFCADNADTFFCLHALACTLFADPSVLQRSFTVAL
jgi:hypothetical protein